MNKLLLICLLLGLSGCANVIEQQITGTELYEMDQIGQTKSFVNINWYKGSNAQFHYFHVTMALQDGDYRIPRNDLTIKQTMLYSKNRDDWKEMYLSTNSYGDVEAIGEEEFRRSFKFVPAPPPATVPYDPNALRL